MNPEQQTPQPTPQQPAPQTIQPDPAQVAPVAPSVQQPQMLPPQPLASQTSDVFINKFKSAGRSSLVFGSVLGILLLIGLASLMSTGRAETISPISYIVLALEGAILIGLVIVGAKLRKTTDLRSGNILVSRLLTLSGVLFALTVLSFSVVTALTFVLFIYLLTVKHSLNKVGS